MKKIGIFVDRFQPFYFKHKNIINNIINSDIDKLIIFIAGANQNRSMLNPWSYEERKLFIESFLEDILSKIIILPLNEYKYNNKYFKNEIKESLKFSLNEDFNNENIYLFFSDINSDINYGTEKIDFEGNYELFFLII